VIERRSPVFSARIYHVAQSCRPAPQRMLATREPLRPSPALDHGPSVSVVAEGMLPQHLHGPVLLHVHHAITDIASLSREVLDYLTR